jgi:hypothetical protein
MGIKKTKIPIMVVKKPDVFKELTFGILGNNNRMNEMMKRMLSMVEIVLAKGNPLLHQNLIRNPVIHMRTK